MKLFEDMERHDVGVAAYAESKSEYLNRSARPEFCRMREALEGWFSRYPDHCKSLLRSRFRHQEGDDHLPAFFELFVHELVLRTGCHVDVLDAPGRAEHRRPDFLVDSPDHGSFYLEATLVTEKSKEDHAERAITEHLYDQLNHMLDSPNFFLNITVHGAPATSPPARSIATDLSGRLAELDPDVVSRLYQSEGWESLPTWRYSHAGCMIVFEALPKAPKARGRPDLRPLGMMGSGEATLVESARFIRQKVEKKAKAYGRLDLPYVVAVNALGKYAGYDDFEEALFAGLGTTSAGAFSPTHRRVSAVLATVRMSPSHVTRAGLQLYQNPWARIPYECSLSPLPRVILAQDGLERIDGQAVAAIIGLSAEWPEGPHSDSGS